ncbi:hypothetical protein GA0116948_11413 [Chitinophaga costaii]|uniref:Dolichyl-phosphate-mannose-protein mannosyltransferase n=1 Tax=Chitinophaga costaii TaxID=1335309 RepID=A0A1C4FFB9_9BACT|nr:hypothetical protein [Chitinophaga costaii]PUZ20125.1 hypothetical protein DCM91_19530 [Chitinophaga costaii]SCC54688.1 hypothetical protein GA0116948_11413 [Chitinophaga costaii]
MQATLPKYTRFTIIELLTIFAIACVPLFLKFPYRVNIFLSWEGAYRLSQGQVPFKDYGSPLGYGFWLMPALCFKLFGPQLISLVKAQVILNILSGLAFRCILKSLDVRPGIRALSVIVFVLSYSFFNFWPWYNQTVIVYELVAICFLLRFILRVDRLRWAFLALSALFVFLTIFTKQDGGGLTLLLCLALLAYDTLQQGRWLNIPVFLGMLAVIAAVFIVPLLPHFAYWYNHGQAPHNSRLSVADLIGEFFGGSQWIKFYGLLAVLLLIPHLRHFQRFWNNRKLMLFTLLTFGILVEAAIFQVTSYTPPDNNIFFHSFAFAFIFSLLLPLLEVRTESWKIFSLNAILVLLWWSGVYWRYTDRILSRFLPAEGEGNGIVTSATGENVVSRRNYMLEFDSTDVPTSEWIFSSLPEFKNIYMPASTVHGMERFLALPVLKEKGAAVKVLNMTELTPLAHAVPYQLERGGDIPLWYHLGVAMFNRQLEAYKTKVRNNNYDVVLYEYAPHNNNFYPFALQDELKKDYQLVDTFLAPRRPTNAVIEVYLPKK